MHLKKMWRYAVCPVCFRINGPIHWLFKKAGFCDGRSAW